MPKYHVWHPTRSTRTMALKESSQKASRVPAGWRRIGIPPDVAAGSITRI